MFARLPSFWRLHLGGWAVFALAAVPMKLLLFASPTTVLWSTLLREPLGCALCLGLRECFRRRPVPAAPGRRALVVCGLALLVGALDTALAGGVLGLREASAAGLSPTAEWLAQWCARSLIFAGWSGLYFWLKDGLEASARELRAARAEAAAQAAELAALRAQVNPHFLFNALNAVLANLRDDPARAEQVTLGLAEVLRHSLRVREPLAPLGEELAAMENYLRVEEARFEGQLRFRVEADADARAARVPTALLLPLVENALEFGRETSQDGLQIALVAAVLPEHLRVEVANTGHWLPPAAGRTEGGLGLDGLRRRLALLFGAGATLQMTESDGWVRLAVTLPRSP
ncbi:MAG: histidine kinase [Verrucomicrobia bacterium]|nr:histidine kinase [Verrucomicrobiota bacterium]